LINIFVLDFILNADIIVCKIDICFLDNLLMAL